MTLSHKVCSKCKIDKLASEYTPRPERKSGIYSCCKQCHTTSALAFRKAKRLVNPFPLWLTSVFFEAKARAKRKNVACEITKNELEEIYNETKGFCAYCNTQFNFHNTTKTRRDSPSVDRIIPDQGYIKNNLTICCHRCNMIKNEATPTQLLAIANKVHDLATIRNLMAA